MTQHFNRDIFRGVNEYSLLRRAAADHDRGKHMATSRRTATTLFVFVCLAPCINLATAKSLVSQPGQDGQSNSSYEYRLTQNLRPTELTGHFDQLHLSKAHGLIAPDAARWQRVTVESGDSLAKVLRQTGAKPGAWRSALDAGPASDELKHLQPGDMISVKHEASGALTGLRYSLSRTKTLVITQRDKQLHAKVQRLPETTQRIMADGVVRQSLSNSLAESSVPASVANQLADIFKQRNDLSRRIQSGDKFSIMYRAHYSGGERFGSGPIIAATINTHDGRLTAFRAEDEHGDVGYYDRNGQSLQRFISRRPVNYTHISSSFSRSRVNPVTSRREPHYGVDMAASVGTPVHAAADGTVKYKGWIHGYGRILKVDDFEDYSTRYAHMHRFAKGLESGDQVEQGQVIGYVGQTGRTTGPHLHFEIRKNGNPYNPLTMKLPDGRQLTASRLNEFEAQIKPLVAKLDRSSNQLVAARTSVGSPSGCQDSVSVNTQIALDPGTVSTNDSDADLFCIVGG